MAAFKDVSVGPVNVEVSQFEMRHNKHRFNDLMNIFCFYKHPLDIVDIYGQRTGLKFVLDIVQFTPVTRPTLLPE